MGQRIDLHKLLKSTMDVTSANNVYYQPPASVRIAYPCIVYNLNAIDTNYASNLPYEHSKKYSGQYISKTPDDAAVMKIARLPQCRMGSCMVSDNLYHYNFSIYY